MVVLPEPFLAMNAIFWSLLMPKEMFSKSVFSPNDLEIQMQCADVEIVIGELEKGFNRLLQLIASSSGDAQKVAKERLITLFALVDSADPRVIKARAALANALF